jgi:hypothetical protein
MQRTHGSYCNEHYRAICLGGALAATSTAEAEAGGGGNMAGWRLWERGWWCSSWRCCCAARAGRSRGSASLAGTGRAQALYL